MSDRLFSILAGTSGLTALLVVALVVALSREGPPDARILRPAAIGALLVQCAHFAEELAGGFHVRFPALLGLAPWPVSFFAGFNLTWFALWVLSVASLRKAPRAALAALWFLGLASAANGLFHPALASIAGGYFPGLWTSPLAGVAGFVLLRRLLTLTGSDRPHD